MSDVGLTLRPNYGFFRHKNTVKRLQSCRASARSSDDLTEMNSQTDLVVNT